MFRKIIVLFWEGGERMDNKEWKSVCDFFSRENMQVMFGTEEIAACSSSCGAESNCGGEGIDGDCGAG